MLVTMRMMKPGCLLTIVALAGCATQGSSDEGGSLRTERSEATGEPAQHQSVDRVRALVVFPASTRAEVAAAVRARGGRVLVTYDSPAAVIQIPPSQVDDLAGDLPNAVVATGPVEDPDLAAVAPEPIAFWNRQHGAGDGGRDVPGAAREPAPAGHRPEEPPLGPARNLPPELEAGAQATLRRLVRCLAGPPGEAGCLENLVDPEVREELLPQLEREAESARRHNIDPDDYSFVLQGYDGSAARFEMQRDGHPTGTVRLVRRESTWLVSFVDP